jgi:hypothetical protein
MKKFFFCLLTVILCPLSLLAGVTTYTFTSVKWASKVGATVCDGVTDGWICDKEASSYDGGSVYPDGTQHRAGVSVKTGTSGAGATSVLEFEEVRRITFNFCQNSSDGRGAIYVQVGDNAPDSIKIYKPASSTGDLNRDSIINFSTPQSGKIKFWVNCTKNAININSISIRSSSGGSSVFTMDTYQLVTDIAQLEDSDQVIFGVHKDGVNYIMGYFDEYESSNNIHAIKGHYSPDRSQVDPDDRAIYTLWITELNGQTAYIFQDELRYEEAYLVASGGQTKNRLAIWNNVYDEKTYGNYGYWDIQIENGGEAVITNLGNSKAKIIQYNANNNPTLFACYADRSQTPVCLYRRVEAMGDIEAIVAPFVNFGTTIDLTGSRTIEVNANRLTQEISATLQKGEVFSLSSALLDRDGDNLTISYNAPEAGHYIDTLILRSGETETRVAVLLNRINPMTISEAVVQEDYTSVYLKPLVVTKKFNNYVYVRDETGSMLLFDRGDGESGKRYAADTKKGDVLSGVTGRTLNYFGVPEVSLTAQFKTDRNEEVLPEEAGATIDSADVCQYMKLEPVVVKSWTELEYKGHTYAYENKFDLSNITKDAETTITCIVSYDHDVVTLYIVSQDIYNPEGIEDIDCQASAKGLLLMRDGVVLVETERGLFTLTGEQVEKK